MKIPTSLLVKYEIFIIGTLVAILALWWVTDPLHWERQVTEIDAISGLPKRSIGRCVCEHPVAWLGPLGGFLIANLIYGNFLSYKGRNVPSEFSEGKWIAISMVNFLECFVLCIPILLVVADKPMLDGMIKSMFIMIVCAGTLAIIFGPKLVLIYRYNTGLTVKETSVIAPTQQGASTQSSVIGNVIVPVQSRQYSSGSKVVPAE